MTTLVWLYIEILHLLSYLRETDAQPPDGPTPFWSGGCRAVACSERGSAEALQHHRHALPAADAHRFQTDRLIVRAEPVEERGGDAGAGHPEGVAEGDRAAVDVELLSTGRSPGHGPRQHLGRERPVDLDELDVVDRIPARASACFDASTGPRPMISGERPGRP